MALEETYLAVIKRAVDGKIVDVSIGAGRHLGLLNGTNATLRVEDSHSDVLLPLQAVNGCGPSLLMN